MTFLLALIAFVVVASPASADPVSSAIISHFAIKSAVAAFAVRAAVSVGVNALVSAVVRQRQRRASGQSAGIRTQVTTQGGVTPQTTMLGFTATAGNIVCPHYAHGKAGDFANAYRTTIIDLGDMPVTALNAVWVNGRKCRYPEDFAGGDHADYGKQISHPDFGGRLWVKFYDGTQTVPDPYLRAQYGNHPQRPWQADMVGTGIPYVILTMRADPDIWQGDPTFRFEVEGIPLYDPRKDGTAGGTGTQRWSNPSTWSYSANPAVQIYNIMRGLKLPGGGRYGLGASASDLPYSVWAAAMDKCDATVDGQAQYRSGIEISMATAEQGGDLPLDAIDDLLVACDGELVDAGGQWRIRVGAPSLAVAFITDSDLIADEPVELSPFGTVDETYNAVRITHPDPDAGWEATEAPLRTDAAAEARDGQRLVGALDLRAVWRDAQAQRQGIAWVADAQRMVRHVVTLPPRFSYLESLDSLQWSSDEHGYGSKLFEISDRAIDPESLCVKLSLRERDPNDHAVPVGYRIPKSAPSQVVVPIANEPLPGLAFEPVIVVDSDGDARGPGFRFTWPSALADGIRTISWQVRLQSSGVVVARGTTSDVSGGVALVLEGILPDEIYEGRARGLRQKTDWSLWMTARAPNHRIGFKDLDPSLGVPRKVDALPTGDTGDEYLVYQGRLHRWNGASWVDAVDTSELIGTILEQQFKTDLTPPKIVDTLPVAGNWPGRVVVHEGVLKVWDNVAGAWFNKVNAVDVQGLLTSSQIADLAAAKITGQVVANQIADGVLSAPKFSNTVKPIEIVPSLPAAPHTQGRTVLLTTDNKLYRNTGSGWTAAVPTADLTGQITDAQIASLAAAKVSGQLTNVQLADIAAAKVTGQIVNSQIADLAASKITGQIVDNQIGSMAASKVTGTLSDAQIASIAAPKITGTLTNAQIADLAAAKLTGQITGTQISDGSISTPELAAGAVTADKVAANAITAGKIAANAVTANEISGGAVTTAKLAAGAITSDKIGANAVVAGKIAANAVTANEIAAGAITTVKLAAGAVTADRIGAQQIETSHLRVTGKGQAMNPDPYFEDLIEWKSGGTPVVVSGNDAYAGGRYLRFDSTYNGFTAVTAFTIDPAKVYRVKIVIRRPYGDGKFYGMFRFYDSAGAGIGHNNAYWPDGYGTNYYWPSFQNPGAGWAVYERLIGPGQTHNFPPNTATCRIGGYFGYAQTAATRTDLGLFLIETAVDGNLIVDGAVTADKVAADAITSGKIAAGAITTGKIVAGAVTANELAANSVTAAAVSAGAVTAGKIAASAVTANEIAANAVTSAKISAGAVTAGKIAANAVTANELAAGAVTTAKLAAGAVTANEIAAKAISASKLVVADTSNMLPDPSLQELGVWAYSPTFSLIDNPYGSLNTDRVVQNTTGPITGLGNNGFHAAFYNDAGRFVPCLPDKEYLFEAKARGINGAAKGTFAFYARFLAWDGSALAGEYEVAKVVDLPDATQVLSMIVKAPANAAFVGIRWRIGGNIAGEVSGTSYLWDIGVRRAAAGELIVDGAITTDKLTANAVTADKLAANAVTANKIAANSVSAAKLTVGGGGNLVPDSTFAKGMDCVGFGGSGGSFGQTTTSIRSPGASWAGSAYPTLMIYQGGTATDGAYAARLEAPGWSTSTGGPAAPGKTYSASVQLSCHRCQGCIELVFRNSAGTGLGWHRSPFITDVQSSSTNPDEWPTTSIIRVAPANTAYVQMTIYKLGTLSGTTSYVFAHKPMVAETIAGATEVTPYSPSGATQITGGEILTGAITTDKIAANAITGAKILAGTITADKILSNSITADRIAANAITANELASNAVTAVKIAANAVTADKINVSSLSAISANMGTIQVDTANIANLSVQTAKIDNLAVTNVGVGYSNAQVNATYQVWEYVAQVSVQMGPSGSFHVTGQADLRFSSGYEVIFRLLRDGVELTRVTQHAKGSAIINYVDNGRTNGVTYQYKLEMFVTSGSGSQGASAVARFIKVQEFKK